MEKRSKLQASKIFKEAASNSLTSENVEMRAFDELTIKKINHRILFL